VSPQVERPRCVPRPTPHGRDPASGDLARFWLAMPASARESGGCGARFDARFSSLLFLRVESVAGADFDPRAPRPPTRNLFPNMRQRKSRLVNPFSRRSTKKSPPATPRRPHGPLRTPGLAHLDQARVNERRGISPGVDETPPGAPAAPGAARQDRAAGIDYNGAALCWGPRGWIDPASRWRLAGPADPDSAFDGDSVLKDAFRPSAATATICSIGGAEHDGNGGGRTTLYQGATRRT
jgi:hypothetical protein